MSDPLRTPEDYELFIYSLPEQFKSIRQSTITLVRLGASLGRAAGELQFDRGFRLVARERILFGRLPVLIDWYGYEVWRGDEKLFWYIRNRIRAKRYFGKLILITNTFHPTSNTTASPLHK